MSIIFFVVLSILFGCGIIISIWQMNKPGFSATPWIFALGVGMFMFSGSLLVIWMFGLMAGAADLKH